MAYYDELVNNPDAALDKVAERRGDSREAMAARLDAIRSGGAGRGHITLGQAQSFFDKNSPPPQDLVAHVNQCNYCTALLDGLEATAVEESLAAALRRMDGEQPAAPQVTADDVATIGEPLPVATMVETRPKDVRWHVAAALGATAIGAFYAGTTVTDGQGEANMASMDAAPIAEAIVEDAVNPAEYANLRRQIAVMQAELDARDPDSRAAAVSMVSDWVVVDADRSTMALRRVMHTADDRAPSLTAGDSVFVLDSDVIDVEGIDESKR